MTQNLTSKLNEISVIYPCYNEEDNINELISQSLEIIPNIAEKYEIIIVNDGSKDSTSVMAHKLAKKHENIVVVDQENKGYGGAVKTGFKTAKYDWVFFTDSDLQFDLKDLYKFVHESKFNDLIIGYRVNRADGFKRSLIAKMLKVWNRVFLGFPLYIKDIDCAFKLIHKVVLNDVGELVTSGAMLTTEFLLKAHKLGYKIAQIGVSHYPRKAGKSTGSNIGVILKAVRETFVLRYLMETDSRFNTVKLAFRNIERRLASLMIR